jgi:uroporphyrinogen decarboxylase
MTTHISPRDRIILTLNHEESDIIPYHIAIDNDCLEQLEKNSPEAGALLSKLDNHLPHIGLEPHQHWTADDVFYDDFGCGWKDLDGVPHLFDSPLKEPDLKNYTFPDILDEKYFQDVDSFIDRHPDHYRLCGIVFGYFDRGWALRGYENFLSDVVLNPNFVEALLERLADSFIHLIDKVAAYPFDGIRFADDWGYQRGIVVGAKRWRELFLPGIRKVFHHAREKNLTVMVHADGDLTEIIPDLIESGVQILNPVQPECMDILWLKKEYGKDMCFNGGISSQLTIPRGTPKQIKKEIRAAMRYLGKDGGYIVGPTKSLNSDTLIDNNLAVLEGIINQDWISSPGSEDNEFPEQVEELWAVYRAFHSSD